MNTPNIAEAAERAAYQARVSAVLGGQIGLPVPGGTGIRALWRCSRCGRPWLMDSREPHGSRLGLSLADLVVLASELHADLAHLPAGACRACGAAGLGEISIDGYGGLGECGYGVSWEGPPIDPAADPPVPVHLVGTTHRSDWLRAQQGRHIESGVVLNTPQLHAWLRWLAQIHAPIVGVHPITAAESARLAQGTPPGYGLPGTQGWRWQGAAWEQDCRALGGRVAVMLSRPCRPASHLASPP